MADLKKVVEILKAEGVNDEGVATFITDLNNMMAQKIQVELISVLDNEEEMARLNELPEEKMNEELATLYKKKTGKDIADVSDEILDGFVTGFLTQYHKQKLEEQSSK
ncbi:MAG: hypothetical protein A2126_01080 [Candidatus Woykebacteria bacterium GWB1_45_5]|uniref:Uncharacterized protein n=2 Tax=Candidatus Woykeibacteriota TaxID=1817899 RepID=A0A1G1W322_9BACT|nr:MAG: hypothetical protein A2113_02515 [Candidatus Woykebacteria bacterium GWA1_44_8]OGY22743.1 MAG: hypothetical protein A2126_01080 [Candidatus Woykebacteria bacterium GWB1_45_5]